MTDLLIAFELQRQRVSHDLIRVYSRAAAGDPPEDGLTHPGMTKEAKHTLYRHRWDAKQKVASGTPQERQKVYRARFDAKQKAIRAEAKHQAQLAYARSRKGSH